MLERILSKLNMTSAFKRVAGNRSAGIDGMGVSNLNAYLQKNWVGLRTAILDGSYRPQPVKGVGGDKPKGGKRLLGVPTVFDRLTQQAIQQVPDEIFEPQFSRFSYGFRKGKSAHQAIHQALGYANSGSRYVVDIDLSKFFDRVSHDYLMNLFQEIFRTNVYYV